MSLRDDDGIELVGVNVSGLLFAGGYKRNDAFGFQLRYVDDTFKMVDMLIREKNVRVLLIPHTLGTGTESDSIACEALYEKMKDRYPDRIGVVRGSYDPSGMKYIIGQCNFFIGARMHACIAALSQGIPAVAFAYSRKFVGVLETLNVEKLVIDPKALTSDDVLRLVSKCFDEREEFRNILESRLPEVKSELLRLFSEIGSVSPSVPDNEAVIHK
jgi:polysaccharide pyruvyl transferase WcaK-like protein